MVFTAVIALVLVAITFLIILAIINSPVYFRSKGMARLAKEYGLSFDPRHSFLNSFKDRNFISGTVGGHQITIYDAWIVDPSKVSMSRQVKVIFDGTERKVFDIVYWRHESWTSINAIRKFLEQVKSGQA